MAQRIIAVLAITALSVTACGGSDASGVQGEAADKTISDLKAENIGVDEGCVQDAAKDLTDADAQAVLDNTPLTEAGEQIGLAMFLECTDIEE
jgi:hypothetical protein